MTEFDLQVLVYALFYVIYYKQNELVEKYNLN